jgi:hypothetical protein
MHFSSASGYQVRLNGSCPASSYAFLTQVVKTRSVLLHCHWDPKVALANGFGRVNLTDRKAVAQPSAMTKAISAISLLGHHFRGIAVTPVSVDRH